MATVPATMRSADRWQPSQLLVRSRLIDRKERTNESPRFALEWTGRNPQENDAICPGGCFTGDECLYLSAFAGPQNVPHGGAVKLDAVTHGFRWQLKNATPLAAIPDLQQLRAGIIAHSCVSAVSQRPCDRAASLHDRMGGGDAYRQLRRISGRRLTNTASCPPCEDRYGKSHDPVWPT